MSKNEDRASKMKPVELTDEELSLASGGCGPIVVIQNQVNIQNQTALVLGGLGFTFVRQTQVSTQNQLAIVGGLHPASVTQSQISLQDQGTIIN